MSHHILKPRITEKAFAASQSNHTFVLDVPAGLSKQEIASSVEEQFESVKVKSVRIVNRPGKVKRTISLTGKRSSNRPGVQRNLRKAYVTLSEGHLPFFAAEEKEIEDAKKAAEKEAKKAEKKSAAKPAKKETK